MERLFGTDGVRGRVGEFPLLPEAILRLGWAAGCRLSESTGRLLIGRDTRSSGEMVEASLTAGLMAAGIEVCSLGILPTPAIAHLTRSLRASAGAVISASHNPYHDNGVKFFGPDGFKLPDRVEGEIEALFREPLKLREPLGKAERLSDGEGRYIEFCKATYPRQLPLPFRLVLDCAHGATFRVAPSVFRELGAEIVALLGAEPDGRNINRGCGATHPEPLREKVLETGADLGVAFDGDGDRVVLVDEKGEIADGDDLLYLLALAFKERGKLRGPVVGTVMTNFGLERRFRELGIPFLRTRVGDRYVLEALLREGGVLGGESSGHLVLLDRTTTGDGILTALAVMAEMVRRGRPLSELKRGWERLPQRLENVRVAQRPADPLALPEIARAVREAEAKLKERGRVLIRPSGTEPVVRIMVEGEEGELVEALVAELAQVVRKALE